MYKFIYAFRRYFCAAVLLAVIFGTMYVLVQQSARMQANDTPTLIATQAAKQLDAGLGLDSINMGATDLANNPIPFVIVYDKNGKAVAGSGYLDKELAVVPKGVLTHAKSGSNNAVTWSPKDSVRIASVTVAAKDYYVLGGQSLKLTEEHAHRLLLLTIAGYAATLVLLAGYGLLARFARR